VSRVVRDALDAVVALPRGPGKRQAWAAAHALARHADARGVTTVTVDQLMRETGLSARTLRAGFEALEAAGLLDRDELVKKPGSDEWQPRTYRFRPVHFEQVEMHPIGVMSAEPRTGANRTSRRLRAVQNAPLESGGAGYPRHVPDDPLCVCDDCMLVAADDRDSR
jgi:hypothetical protein